MHGAWECEHLGVSRGACGALDLEGVGVGEDLSGETAKDLADLNTQDG